MSGELGRPRAAGARLVRARHRAAQGGRERGQGRRGGSRAGVCVGEGLRAGAVRPAAERGGAGRVRRGGGAHRAGQARRRRAGSRCTSTIGTRQRRQAGATRPAWRRAARRWRPSRGRGCVGARGNAGLVPGQVADKLRGRRFGSFDEFRAPFWKAVADTPELVAQFSQPNPGRMRQGLAPLDLLLGKLVETTPHTGISDMIFYPDEDRTPAQIMDEALRREREHVDNASATR